MRKRIAVIHDLPSFGGAALMNIIPIMYSMGVEVNPIPTALFTSHGGFKGVKKLENDSFIYEYLEQWQDLKLCFNGIYLGLLTSSVQAKFAMEFIKKFNNSLKLVLLDPIMGDNGRVYGFINQENINNMKELLSYSSIITPNLTEAYLLLDKDYNENPDEGEVISLVKELSSLGPENIILTSVIREDRIFTYIYQSKKQELRRFERKVLHGYYPGTGDAFSSVLIGEILRGNDVNKAALKAIEFVEKGIKLIIDKKMNPIEGLPLSEAELIKMLIND